MRAVMRSQTGRHSQNSLRSHLGGSPEQGVMRMGPAAAVITSLMVISAAGRPRRYPPERPLTPRMIRRFLNAMASCSRNFLVVPASLAISESLTGCPFTLLREISHTMCSA